MKYAPVVLIVYNRPKHLLKTLNSLKKNPECKYTDLFIFSDGFKNDNDQDQKKVLKVRKLIRKVNFFRKKKIIEKKENLGLKKIIIDSINYVMNKKSKVIVLEDDIIVSKFFLNFMNTALNKYRPIKKIWHISAWNYSISVKSSDSDAFFIKNMNCWGWGTWKNRWKKIKINPKFFEKKFTKKDKYLFNLNNSFENFSQITRNAEKKISTWAIFWNATIFLNNGLCLNPVKSFTINIGQDASGTNTVNPQLLNNRLNNKKKFKLPTNIIEDLGMRKEIINHLRRKKDNFLNKILRNF